MSMIKTGVKASDIGRTIESTIKQMGFKPIANLSGHSLDQYTIHAGRSIPNIWSIGGFSLSRKYMLMHVNHLSQQNKAEGL